MNLLTPDLILLVGNQCDSQSVCRWSATCRQIFDPLNPKKEKGQNLWKFLVLRDFGCFSAYDAEDWYEAYKHKFRVRSSLQRGVFLVRDLAGPIKAPQLLIKIGNCSFVAFRGSDSVFWTCRNDRLYQPCSSIFRTFSVEENFQGKKLLVAPYLAARLVPVKKNEWEILVSKNNDLDNIPVKGNKIDEETFYENYPPNQEGQYRLSMINFLGKIICQFDLNKLCNLSTVDSCQYLWETKMLVISCASRKALIFDFEANQCVRELPYNNQCMNYFPLEHDQLFVSWKEIRDRNFQLIGTYPNQDSLIKVISLTKGFFCTIIELLSNNSKLCIWTTKGEMKFEKVYDCTIKDVLYIESTATLIIAKYGATGTMESITIGELSEEKESQKTLPLVKKLADSFRKVFVNKKA